MTTLLPYTRLQQCVYLPADHTARSFSLLMPVSSGAWHAASDCCALCQGMTYRLDCSLCVSEVWVPCCNRRLSLGNLPALLCLQQSHSRTGCLTCKEA